MLQTSQIFAAIVIYSEEKVQTMINDSLAQLPIFQGMSDSERGELLAIGHRVDVGAGELIIAQGNLFRNL